MYNQQLRKAIDELDETFAPLYCCAQHHVFLGQERGSELETTAAMGLFVSLNNFKESLDKTKSLIFSILYPDENESTKG